ncbi:hypothetical protein [Candidatus Nitrosacidococcus sp. I8]|uniref:hypothetical protein n=1 Tax=Candidatus Nitrosacidococcus sp. I8 TaxID=2942908 RepID=UPI00222601FC|nr:hypothetical protein [Candidatus Nitrosacidococcus sp. I8]
MILIILWELKFPVTANKSLESSSFSGLGAESEKEQSLKKDSLNNTLPPLTHYQEIIARPLFHPDRKPLDPEEEDEDNLTPEERARRSKNNKQIEQPSIKDRFTLNGIAMDGGKAVALLEDHKEKKILRLSQGEQLENWKIQNILSHSVVFSLKNRTETLDLVRIFASNPKKATRPIKR